MKSVESEKKPLSLRMFISKKLKKAAEGEAKRRGISLSQFIRSAIEKAIPTPKDKS
jgi:predicted HicB family RNase H-like nuclease